MMLNKVVEVGFSAAEFATIFQDFYVVRPVALLQ
jgi:hypothetical protein